MEMIETTLNKVVYEVTGNSNIFAFPIRFFQPSDIVCYLDDKKLNPDTDFSVETKEDYSSGANITLNVDGKIGSKFVIMRVLPEIQETSLPVFGKLPSSSIEIQLDKIVMICQQMREMIDRTIKVDPSADKSPDELIQEIMDSRSDAMEAAENASAARNAAEAAAQKVTRTYSSIASMIEDEQLVEGQFIRTTGYYASGDGGEMLYEVSSAETDYSVELPGGLFANPVFGSTVHLAQFGARGNGTADDTAAIQRALDYAGTNKCSVVGRGNYRVSGVTVKSGTVAFSVDGTISGADNEDGSVIELGSESAPLAYCDIGPLRVSMAGAELNAIHGFNTQVCRFHGIRITGYGTRTTQYGIRLEKGSNFNVIDDCMFDASGASPNKVLHVAFQGTANASHPWGGFYEGMHAGSVNPSKWNIITNCVFTRGYAIDFGYCCYSIISNNQFYYSDHRGIYLANASDHNVISGNSFTECWSSAILLGYSCWRNVVTGNSIRREASSAGGEAAINVNTGSCENVISGNHVNSNNNYGIYIATDSCRNLVDANVVRGYVISGIALENNWSNNPSSYSVAARPNYGPPATGRTWSRTGLSGNSLTNNLILDGNNTRFQAGISITQTDGVIGNWVSGTVSAGDCIVGGGYVWQCITGGTTGSSEPAWSLETVEDGSATWERFGPAGDAVSETSIADTLIFGNKVTLTGSGNASLFLYYENSNWSGVRFLNNMLSSKAGAMIRSDGETNGTSDGVVDWCEGSTELDKTICDTAFPLSNATASLKTNCKNRPIICSGGTESAPLTISSFTNLPENGREFTVRLAVYTTIAHGGIIHLRGQANVTGRNSSDFITFKNYNGHIFEISRSWE